ncbi:uncharacterized protein CBL_12519 [Carabus blaptoides fortunei]
MTANTSDAASEVRENISLKTGAKKTSWFSCKDECLGGSRLVILSFTGLTIAITISLIIQIYYGDYQIVPHGSVATDSTDCSLIGVDILKQGGNAVDAAIGSALCLAVVNPHNTGVDARGVLMIYSHRTRAAPEIIDFSNETTIEIDNIPFTRLLTGLAYAHLKYGKLPWRDLVKPAANLASQGFIVSSNLAQAVGKAKVEHLFSNLVAGKNVSFEILASTLHQIADISENHLKEHLLSKTELEKTKSLKTTFHNYNIYVPDSPTTGPLLALNLQHVNNISFTDSDVPKPEYMYRLAELLQQLYADKDIVDNFHEGTSSNVAAVDLDDVYVSLVTGMYTLFGTQELTPRGYILDVNATINTNTRLPIIITDKKYICGRRIVMGTGDLSIATQVITSLLIGGEDASTSVEGPRFRILGSNIIGTEDARKIKLDPAVSIYLQSLGKLESLPEPYSSCNVVEKSKDDLSSHSDSRGGGIAYRF